MRCARGGGPRLGESGSSKNGSFFGVMILVVYFNGGFPRIARSALFLWGKEVARCGGRPELGYDPADVFVAKFVPR